MTNIQALAYQALKKVSEKIEDGIKKYLKSYLKNTPSQLMQLGLFGYVSFLAKKAIKGKRKENKENKAYYCILSLVYAYYKYYEGEENWKNVITNLLDSSDTDEETRKILGEFYSFCYEEGKSKEESEEGNISEVLAFSDLLLEYLSWLKCYGEVLLSEVKKDEGE